ncbi:MAG: hypothetical protein OEY28_04390 [Nitrospira sp.]|nr:hypothetical protein [Nitrospira sp.]
MPEASAPAADWVDIVAPEAALVSDALWIYGGLALVTLLAAGVLLLWANRPRQRARRELRRLLRMTPESPQQSRHVCAHISRCLQIAFAQQQLSAIAFAASHRDDWLRYIARLQSLRFAAAPPTAEQCRQAVQDALRWLSTPVEDR